MSTLSLLVPERPDTFNFQYNYDLPSFIKDEVKVLIIKMKTGKAVDDDILKCNRNIVEILNCCIIDNGPSK